MNMYAGLSGLQQVRDRGTRMQSGRGWGVHIQNFPFSVLGLPVCDEDKKEKMTMRKPDSQTINTQKRQRHNKTDKSTLNTLG